MTQEVEHNGQIHEFPDEATPEMIAQALGVSYEQPKAPEPTSDEPGYKPSGLAGSLVGKLGHAAGVVGSDILGSIGDVAGGVMPLTRQLSSEPGRALSNVAATVPRIGHGIINSPHDLPGYLAHIGFIKPETAEKLSSYIPAQKDISSQVAQFTGTEQGDEENEQVQREIELLFGLAPGGKTMGRAAWGAAKVAAKAPGKVLGFADPVMVAKQKYLESKIPGMEEGAEKAAQSHFQDTDSERIAKEQAKRETGSADYSLMEKKLNATKEKLGDINEQLSSQTEEKHTVPASIDEAKINLGKAEDTHKEAKNVHDTLTGDIESHLGKGQAHDVRAAAKIDEIQDARRKEIGQEFQNVEQSLADKSVQIDNSDAIKKKTDELVQFVKNNETSTPEARAVLKELSRLESESGEVSAKDYLAAYRSVRDYAREARKNAYTPGMNAEERALWKKRYNELDQKVEEMGTNLEDAIGPEDSATLKSANKRWREEVVPLYKNSTYQTIHKKGRVTDDIMKSLRGSEAGDKILKDIIQNDPELLKNVVGQRYAHKVGDLHEFNETAQGYIDKMPELKKLIQAQKEAKATIERTKDSVESAKAANKAAESAHKEKLAHQDHLEKMREEQKSLEKLAEGWEKNIPILQKRASATRITLKEKMEASKALGKQKRELARTKEAIVKSRSGIAKYVARYAMKFSGMMGI